MNYILVQREIIVYTKNITGEEILNLLNETLKLGSENFWSNLRKEGFNGARTLVTPNFEYVFEYKDGEFKMIK